MSRSSLSFAVLVALGAINPAAVAAPSELAAKFEAQHGKSAEAKLYYVRHTRGAEDAARSQLSGLGGEIRDHFPRIGTYLVSLPAPAAANVAERAQASNSNAIAAIEPVPEYRMLEQVVPWNVDQFQAREVWDQDRDGQVDSGAPDLTRVKVCVIDSGIHRGHSDFAGITITGEGEGAVGAWDVDGTGHGTHVAGTINAANNLRGVVGVLPGSADLHIVKVFSNSGAWGGGSLASAVQKCRNAGAHIINMSLGGPGASSTENSMLQDVYDTHGILSVAAAGNDGNGTRSYPASYDSVISVAAVDQEQALAAEFSQNPASSYNAASPPANSHWDTVELAGGGVQVLSTVPGPDGEVPRYLAQAGGETFLGGRVSGHAEPTMTEYMPEGDLTANLVDGGRCLENAGNSGWAGAVVLCERGDASFAIKVNEAKAQGAAAVIIYNNAPGSLNATCASNCTTPSIPALALSQSKGQALLASVGQPVRVVIDDGGGCTDCEGGYEFMSGTSMASPGVTGAISLIWNACGGPAELPNKTLRRMVRESARDLQGVQPVQAVSYGAGVDRVTGWGLPQVSQALDIGGSQFGANCALNLGVAPAAQAVCTRQATSIDVLATLSERFQGSATLSVEGAPAGSGGAFSTNPVVHPAKQSLYTLGNLDAVAAGHYTLDFIVTDDSDGNISSRASAELAVHHDAPEIPVGSSPAHGASGVSPLAQLVWQPLNAVTDYEVDVARDAAFTDIVYTTTRSSTQVTTPPLDAATRYYWRVRARNSCGAGGNSATYSFTTGATQTQSLCNTTVTPIPDNNSGGVNSVIVVPSGAGTLIDLDLRFEANHTWSGDLVARLTRQGGTTATLIDRPGYPIDSFGCKANNPQLTLDDEGTDGSAEDHCALGTNEPAYNPSGRYTPNSPLAAFDGADFAGTWTLNVSDLSLGDGGSLTRWCLEATTAGSGAGNVPPVFASEEFNFHIIEGAAASTAVGTLTASDAESGSLSYSILSGNASGAFALDADTGALSVGDAAAIGAADVVHLLQVQVEDAQGGTDTASVRVQVRSADGRIMRDGFEG